MPSLASWVSPAPCRWRRRALGGRPERGSLAQPLPYVSGPSVVRFIEAGITGPGRSAAPAMCIGESAEVGPAGWACSRRIAHEGFIRGVTPRLSNGAAGQSSLSRRAPHAFTAGNASCWQDEVAAAASSRIGASMHTRALYHMHVRVLTALMSLPGTQLCLP